MKHDARHGKNLKLAGFFLLVVIILIILSFILRVTVLIANSRFDGKHQFILEIRGNTSPKLVGFLPESHALTILTVAGDVHETEIAKETELPIDAYITGQVNDSVAKALWNSMMSFHTQADINLVDKIKLWLFATSVHSDALSISTVTVPIAEDTFTNVVQKNFLDKTIYQETKTIEIINASGIPGFGGRLARLITNIGGDVIMVSTAQSLTNHSTAIYSGMYSYTNKRIDKVLHMQETLSSDKPALADIIITLGRDMQETQAF